MDKPAAAKAPYFALSDHVLLALEGRDAIAFVQAQCMSDVAALADGQWQWSGWLTPKGRVQALFLLLRVGPETVWLVLPDGDAAGLKAAMERFVFRSKVRLSLPDGLAPCASFSAPAAASGAMSATDARGRVELDLGDGTTARTLRICSGCPAPVDQDALARWRAFDLAHGVPRPGAGTGALEAWTPQQLSLERLKAYSVRKGCYPGQEIVARTHFLGQAKRGLALFGSDAVPPAGAQVMDGERAVGNVVAAAPSAGHGAADAASGVHAGLVLAVLPVERPDGSPRLTVDDHALVPLPLLDGLAR
ncbi:MAG TPA: folate-binding protein [Luteimonas sp.]